MAGREEGSATTSGGWAGRSATPAGSGPLRACATGPPSPTPPRRFTARGLISGRASHSGGGPRSCGRGRRTIAAGRGTVADRKGAAEVEHANLDAGRLEVAEQAGRVRKRLVLLRRVTLLRAD